MNIVIACGAMPFGPFTLDFKSLGGSETAALMLGKELAKLGHKVKMFCNLPPVGEPDAWQSGQKAPDRVSYISLQQYQGYAGVIVHDLAIIVRDPNIAALPSMARKKVLWMHDIATKRGMGRAFDGMAWTIDEVWTVSEWHRQQVHEATGFPLEYMVPLRNGIVPVQTMDMGRIANQLVYAARPERGLANLVRPGGIMERLPEFNLKVAMYAHFPADMRDFYNFIMQRIEALPNVEYVGSLPQAQLRQLIANSAAYIYPTQFEETSCILARECIEQRTPFLTTRVGALPETLGDCGIYFEDWQKTQPDIQDPGTDQWCRQFADFVRARVNGETAFDATTSMMQRIDLYWDGVAETVMRNAAPRPAKVFSRAWSLMEDGDVIAAREYIASLPQELVTPPIVAISNEIADNYPFIRDPSDPDYVSIGDYYEWVYQHKAGTAGSELRFVDDFVNPRLIAIAEEIVKLPPGSRVLEYGCGAGHVLAALAKRFPHIDFVGVEISPAAVKVLQDGATAAGYKNLYAYVGDTVHWPYELHGELFEAAIISEVLEHVMEPWALSHAVEYHVKVGGKMIVTTPFGPWEQATVHQPGKWNERAHIWHLDGEALFEMFGHLKDFKPIALPVMGAIDGRPVGNTVASWTVEIVNPPRPLNPLLKAMQHHSRQTCVACVIAYNNEDTILRMLNSIKNDVQWVNIALGPCTDDTVRLIEDWFREHPYIGHTIIEVPKIEPRRFGFDDARNVSIRNVREFDWMIWIDTDEYLSGSFAPYLRNNMHTGYIIPQHHFTCEPRGMPTQMDRPARLLRTDAGYLAYGHIHEHFTLSNGEIGRCFMLPSVDLGHTGYVNEMTRQGRFFRNFEFLKWDEEEGTTRELHKFLWFRDMIHRMRMEHMRGNPDGARALAEEAVAFYNTHWEVMAKFGQGVQMAIQYLGEAYKYLGRGIPFKMQFGFDDKGAVIEGLFENYEQFERVFRFIVDREFKDRTSRYW